jgi:LCP family protein required for cell wall assembly
MPYEHDRPAQPETLSSDDAPARRRAATRPKRRGRSKRRHQVLTVLLGVGTALALVVGLGSVYFLRHLDDNVDYHDYDPQLTNRPEKVAVDTGPQEPLNILVMGSDTREGAGNAVDGYTDDTERSDTTIMFHLSADRTFAYGISIPRDTLVDRPECIADDGSKIPAADDVMWNDAFEVGGPACTMQQFEQITGVRLDNYVKVDFHGFKGMVDAIGGVEVCLPEAIHDTKAHVDIPAGVQTIRGDAALGYVRARYSIGDGSDLGRIKRQQAFLAAMSGKLVSKGTLTRPDRVLGFLDAATRSLQTNFSSVGEMADVGSSFKSIGLDNIKFVTVPWQYSPEDPNRVEWLPEAAQLWRRVMLDKPLAGKAATGVISAGDDVEGGTPSGSGSESASPSESPSESPSSGAPSGSGAATDDERASAGLCT